MKWLTTVLALYLFSLSLWPCADEFLPKGGRLELTVWVSALGAVPGSAHEQHDLCTPFCTCACCTATLMASPLPHYQLSPSVVRKPISTKRPAYIPLRWAEPLSAIWQPPKLRA